MKKASKSEFPNWFKYPFGYILVTHTANSLLSWLIMYVTNSQVSHVAIMYGDGLVLDTTTDGVYLHSFEDFFDGESHIGIRKMKGGMDKERAESRLGASYNWSGAFLVGINVCIGNSIGFCWRVILDIVILGIILIIISSVFFKPLFYFVTFSVVLYCITVLVNQTIRKKSLSDILLPKD
jgi:hypothetical protein